MLTPEYLSTASDTLLGMMDELNTAIIEDVARKIAKTGKITSTTKKQLEILKESGELTEDVIKQIARVNGVVDKEIEKIFNTAGIQSMKNDAAPLVKAGKEVNQKMTPAMKEFMKAAIAKTQGDVRNLTMTTGATAANLYNTAVNQAYLEASSGAFSYEQAIQRAIKKAAVDGSTVTYPSGHTSSLDVAIRSSVITGLNQTAAKLTEMYSKELGAEYYETTAHAGARPTHAEWQGRVFKIEGSTPDYPNFAEATGYGTAGGLCGVNCRHSFFPFFPGISSPAYSKKDLAEYDAVKHTYRGKNLTEYECTQVQRAHERKIRQYKREIASYLAAIECFDDPEQIAEYQRLFQDRSVKLKAREKELKKFCNATDRRYESARTQVVAHKDQSGRIVNFGRSQSMKAVWANRKRG